MRWGQKISQFPPCDPSDTCAGAFPWDGKTAEMDWSKGQGSPERPKQMARGGQELSKCTENTSLGHPKLGRAQRPPEQELGDGTRQHLVDFFFPCEFIQTLLKPIQPPAASSSKELPQLSMKGSLPVFVMGSLF